MNETGYEHRVTREQPKEPASPVAVSVRYGWPAEVGGSSGQAKAWPVAA
jgi:hypothetical protein